MASSNISFQSTTTQDKYYWGSMAGTILLVIIGIYLIYRHHKSVGFWWGFGAMLLIGSSVLISENATKLNIGGFDLSVTDKNKVDKSSVSPGYSTNA